MKTASFYSYLPKRYTTDNVQTERIRRFIYSFKRGDRHAVDFAINIVSECLNKWYGTREYLRHARSEAQQRRAHRQRVVWLLREHRPRLLRWQERDTLRRPHYYRSHGGGVRRRTRSGRR